MSDLYNIIKKVIGEPNKKKAANILYGIEGIEIDNVSYYEQIISNFIRKKDIILPKINGEVIFDLDKDIKEIWDIVFIAQYVIDYWEQMIKNNDSNKQFYNDCLQKLKKIQVQIKSTTSIEMLPEKSLEELKKSIVIFQKIRDSIEHPNENFKIGEELIIENLKGYFKISIPIEYFDGFNKGKIISKKENEVLIERTNEICFPLLEKYNYDPKKLESFFYNVDPTQLSFLLEICDNKSENLYRLPANLFSKTKNFNKGLNYLLKINNSRVLTEEDFILLNKIDYSLKDNYTDNLICLLYNYKNNSNITMDDAIELTRIISQTELNILKNDKDFEFSNKIINNYYYIKNIINNSNTDKLELKELPYDIFGLEDKQKIYMYVNDILFIKDKIFSKDNELSDTLNYWFNYFIENGKLHSYLKDIKDIYINAHIYSPETNEYEYMIELLLSITRMQNLRIKPSKPWIYLELDEEERRQIKLIIDDFKNNHKKVFNTKKIENNSIRKTTEKTKENEKIIEILKSIKERNISFKAYVDELILQSETDYYYLSGFSTIRWYEDELNYLLLRTNNNYDLSVEVIKKLSDNIRINTIKDDGIYYDRDCQEYYTNKIKSNFKKNVDFLLSKFDASKLLEYPSELLYSDEHVFNYLFENYNCNLCKSIFGIDNPKIVGTLMYMNSVLSYYNKNIIDVNSIDIDAYTIIHSSFNDTIQYSNNMSEDIRFKNQEDYLTQFTYDNKKNTKRTETEIKEFIVTKLRNSSAHFRYKIVKDENGNVLEDKIYLYDEYNDGTNNFNIIMNINNLVQIIRQIELDIKNERYMEEKPFRSK